MKSKVTVNALMLQIFLFKKKSSKSVFNIDKKCNGCWKYSYAITEINYDLKYLKTE